MWWFSDYDGTINLNHNDKLDSRDILWINEWKKKNKFAVATGRILPDALALFNNTDIDFDYLICCNGATIYKKLNNEITLLENKSISMDGRKELLDILDEIKSYTSISLSVLDKRYDFSVGMKPAEVYKNPFLKNTVPYKNNFSEGKTIIETSDNLNIAYLFIEEGKVDHYKQMLNNRLKHSRAISTHKNIIEIVHNDVSKAYGIERIMELEKFSKEDIVSSGDGENDIEMLKMAKYSFAMKNHQKNVDKYAKYIISNVFEIAEILKKEGVKYE